MTTADVNRFLVVLLSILEPNVALEALSAHTNLVTGVAIRYALDGQELDRVGVTYVLYNVDSRWKIAVLIVHDPGEVTPTA